MRTHRVLLLTGLAAVASAIAAAVASASPPAPPAYAWAQPGCAPASTCCSQPAFAVGYFLLNSPAAGMAYAWAQPGTAPVTTLDAQPAHT